MVDLYLDRPGTPRFSQFVLLTFKFLRRHNDQSSRTYSVVLRTQLLVTVFLHVSGNYGDFFEATHMKISVSVSLISVPYLFFL